MPASDDTILRHLKRRAKARNVEASVRVVGLDDWARRKGSTYGTIIVDLERREVIDPLPDRSAKWRNPKRKVARPAPPAPGVQTVDPPPARLISPIVAAALCVKPRGLLTDNQAAKVDALKSEWREFAAMRRLAMRFRGILRSKNVAKLGVWLKDAHQSGLYAMQGFARTLRKDLDAVRNAIAETWSNGQTEGQINRLKTLKRAMYGRAGPELLRARMLPQ